MKINCKIYMPYVVKITETRKHLYTLQLIQAVSLPIR